MRPRSTGPFLISGLTHMELQALSNYNAERHRGLVHAEEYRERMRGLQERFDQARDLRAGASNRPLPSRDDKDAQVSRKCPAVAYLRPRSATTEQ